MTDREYLVLLYSFSPFGPARTKLLISYFGSAKKSWMASKKALTSIGLKEKLVSEFISYRGNFKVEDYFNRLRKLSINYVTFDDADYPENLIDLEGAPLVLYVRGRIKSSDANAVAIVGSRKMTSYGKEVAQRFAGELASMGVTIVSGLALGIDAVAHKAATEVGGRCLAVLASGLDRITPLTNYNLAKEIIEKGGAVISESPLGAEIWRSSFPIRNRIISGLSKAIIVVEGAKRSGTLLTASAAAEQGKQVFAVPGQITSPMSGAPHFLIKSGAKMATSVKDILEELNLQLKVDKEKIEKVMPSDKKEGKLLEILEREEMHLDELARISNLKVNDVSSKLTIMELKGLVRNMGGGIYKKT